VLADRESGADYRERVAQRYPPTGVSVSSVMATRKPKGIDDQIIGGIRSIMSPWLGSPPTELPQVTQFKALQRETANMLDQTLAGGMIGAGIKGPKALAKQAAVNAAALGTGYIAGKVVQKVVPAVAKAGIKTIESYAVNTPRPHVTEEFPRLNKKQLKLLQDVKRSGPDMTRSVHESLVDQDVGGVADNFPKYGSLKYKDVEAVANRIKLETTKNLKQAGYKENITVYRTDIKDWQNNRALNNPNWALSTTLVEGGLPAFKQKPYSVTAAYKVRRSDVLSEYVTGNTYATHPGEQELLVMRKNLKPKKR